VALSLAPAPLQAESIPGAKLSPEIAAPALTYPNALATGELTKAWNLLSAQSRTCLTAPQWEAAFRTPPPTSKTLASALLRAFASAETPPLLADVSVGPDQSLIQVSGSVQISYQLVLVKDPAGWRIDLLASDHLNSLQAAGLFLDLVRESATAPRSRLPNAPSGLTVARALLASEVKQYEILQAEVQQDRAQVTVGAEIPVNLVLRATRVGPGRGVDMMNPLVEVSFTSPHPLRLHCPADLQEGVSYAMNRNLAGKRRTEIGSPANVPLIFESTLHTANPADTGESWADPSRHPDGNFVLFADGSLRSVLQKPSFEVTPAQAQPGAPQRPVGQLAPSLRPRPEPR